MPRLAATSDFADFETKFADFESRARLAQKNPRNFLAEFLRKIFMFRGNALATNTCLQMCRARVLPLPMCRQDDSPSD